MELLTLYRGDAGEIDTFKAGVLDLAWEYGFDNHVSNFKDKNDYLNNRSWTYFDYSHFDYAKMRQAMSEFGIHGIEYPGGSVTSGKRHRAFCIWDEHFVSEHIVEVRV